MAPFEAVVLVGHGGIAADTPAALISEFKQLASARLRRGDPHMSAREAELDRIIRTWPRDATSDPYRAGLEAIGSKLSARLGSRRLVVAYNEFCAPSLHDAVAQLVAEGAAKITVLTTMLTPGGSHSEFELPAEVEAIRRAHPGVVIEYAWPYKLDDIADFLLAHIDAR